MDSLIELKVKLINQYLNKDYKYDDTHIRTITGEKIEYFYFNDILFNSIEKSLHFYEPLLLFDSNPVLETKINDIKKIVSSWFKDNKEYKEKDVSIFIEDYKINISEIDSEVMFIVNEYMKKD